MSTPAHDMHTASDSGLVSNGHSNDSSENKPKENGSSHSVTTNLAGGPSNTAAEDGGVSNSDQTTNNPSAATQPSAADVIKQQLSRVAPGGGSSSQLISSDSKPFTPMGANQAEPTNSSEFINQVGSLTYSIFVSSSRKKTSQGQLRFEKLEKLT